MVRNKLSAVFLAFFAIGLFLFSFTSSVFAFSGAGSGTGGDPFIITTCDQLQEMSSATSADYQLGNDIDCSATSTWNSGAGFNPVASFTGSLDGAGYTISDLFINRPGATLTGVFGQLDGDISNVALDSVDITGSNYVGGLVAYLDSGSVSNSSVDGTVSAEAAGISTVYAGGLVAFTYDGTISDVYSEASVSATAEDSSATAYAGGLVAFNQVDVQNAYATGDVNAQGDFAYSGGFAGYGGAGTITNSFAVGTATFTGTGAEGGLIGAQDATSTNSYSVQSPAVGGGSSTGTTGGENLSDFYQLSPLLAVYTGTPAWDFSTTWGFNDTSSLPVFQWQIVSPSPTSIPNINSGGSSESVSAPSCSSAAPTGAPNLFQLKTMGTSTTLYFAPAAGQNNKYVISYGVDSNADMFTTGFDYSNTSGVIPYTVNYLFPGTWYFKVRGQNGCMPGNWSQVMSVKVSSYGSSVGTSNVLGASTTVTGLTGKCTDYTVQSGDSLWSIASAKLGNGSLYKSILEQNNLKSSLINTGLKLKINC